MEPEIGQQILHYRVIRKLGQGGMGSVYLAEDIKLNRKVALKFLPAEMLSDPERLRRFEREAQTVASLNHPNIVTIYSVEEYEGVPFLAMELVDGQVLSELIPKGGQTLDRFFDLAIPIADAVSAAHERGITHRDLKPGNIMVGGDGRVKVLDFGLAKLLEDPAASDATSLATQALTKTGSAMGTVTYMAPEQLKGKGPDQRADIFSLGVVFYQMASGERPFQGETSAEVISSILRDNPAPVTNHRLELPPHLGRIVKRCLEKNPDRRYQTAAELRAELLELKHEIESGAVFEDDVRTRAIAIEKRSNRSLVFVGLAATLLVALLVGGFLLKLNLEPADGIGRTAPTAAPTTVAVLPFSSAGTAADSTFSDGLNEEVTRLMTLLPEMQVVSRATALHGFSPTASTQEIGETLSADYLVLGTVRWGSGGQRPATVRASLQVIRVADDIQIWSDSYDREVGDTLAVQTEIAQRVVRTLGVGVLGLTPGKLPPQLFAVEPPQAPTEPAPIEASAGTASPPPAPAPAPTREATQPKVSAVTHIEDLPVDETPAAVTEPSPATVSVEFTSYAAAGVLTIYADDLQVLNREFAFPGPKRGLFGRRKVAGSLTERVSIPPAIRSLRVYLLVDGKSSLVRLEPSIAAGASYRLTIALDRKDELEATLE